MLVYIGSSNKIELKFYCQHHCPFWLINRPWYYTNIWSWLDGFYFEDYVTAARKDRYTLMCSIWVHDINHPTLNYYSISGAVILFPQDSTENVWVSFDLTLRFVDSWLQSFKRNYLHRTTIYFDKIRCLFNKIPVTIPEHNPYG